MKILVIRNDKLGDFVQAFPAFAMLKASNPALKLTALVPAYTAPLAQICPYLDDVIIDSAKNDNADFIKRFTQEALAAAQLSHPTLVNVYEVEHTDGFYYIVMEFVDGITLKEYIRQKGKLEQQEAIGIAIQVIWIIGGAPELRLRHILKAKFWRICTSNNDKTRCFQQRLILSQNLPYGNFHLFLYENFLLFQMSSNIH